MSAHPGNRLEHGPTTAEGPAGDGRGGGSERSVPDLLRELSGEGADLVRQELALARAELNDKLALFQRNLVSMAVGGAFLLGALLLALWAVNSAVTALLAEVVDLEIAIWLSPLLLAALVGAIGWSMVQKGKASIHREGLTPQATRDSLKDDTRWAKAKARSVKEEMSNG